VAVALAREQRRFAPVADPIRPGGWYWPAVAEVFGDGLSGDQVLERLVALGLAQRAIVERQRLCPICAAHHLSYREVCPGCGGSDHAPPADGGPAALRQCRTCPQRFADGRVEVLCLACGAVGDPADTRERLLHRYDLTAAADLAVAERRIIAPELADLVRDHETGVHARSYLAHEAARELTRLANHQVPVALMLVRLVNLAAVRQRLPAQAEDHARRLYRLVTAELRPLDVTAIVAGDALAVLLPQTTLDEAEALVERIATRSAAEPPLPDITGPDLDLTAIAGQAHDRSLDDLLNAARAALDLPGE
jgi:diguanylate cyclase (GGDEF)-like protein